MSLKCRLGLRGSAKLFLLTVIFVCLLILSLNISKKRPYSILNLGPAFTMIQKNGEIHLDDLTGFEEVSDEQKIKWMEKLRYSIHKLMKNCTVKDQLSMKCRSSRSSEKILTLFTTWTYDEGKFPVNNRTLYNWKTLPNVNLVVFVSKGDKKVEEFSRKAGWEILPVTQEAVGVPVLPDMFQDVMKKYRSPFYGFANGDLLFTGKLTDTLEQIFCKMTNGEINVDKGILIMGRRINVPADILTSESAVSWPKLEQFANQYGKLFQSDAQDYFITDARYPWSTFLPVVVGRRGYDNWIVAFSRYSNITVIDASESIKCIHQTIASRGNFEGITKGDYNIQLVENQNMPFGLGWGRTFCTQWKCWYDFCERLKISERKNRAADCSGYKLSYRVASFFGLT